MPLLPQDLPAHLCPNFHVPKKLLKSQDITLSQLYQWNAKENPDYPLFVYHDPVNAKLEYVTYAAANKAIDRAARFFTHTIARESAARTGSPVIGILANSGASSLPAVYDGVQVDRFSLLSRESRYDNLRLRHHRRVPRGVLYLPHLNAQRTCRRGRYGEAHGRRASLRLSRSSHG